MSNRRVGGPGGTVPARRATKVGQEGDTPPGELRVDGSVRECQQPPAGRPFQGYLKA